MTESKFRNIFSNIVIFILLIAVVFSCVFVGLNKVQTTANSEYNGTIFAGDKNSKNISLMVNVYWGNEYLESMLDTFKKHGIKTTFFVGGSWVKKSEELAKRLVLDGHEIASHGYSHKEHGKLDYQGNLSEIKQCDDIVKVVLNKDMSLFAPPGGSYNKHTTTAASNLGYHTIMWTRDTIDWRDKDRDLIYSRAVTNMQGGDLILMHPTAATATALENIITYAKTHGFFITTVSETLGL